MSAPYPSDLAEHRDWLFSFLRVKEGDVVVDLGCGKGADIVEIASRTGWESCRFIGVDSAEAALAVADKTAQQDSRVSFKLHDLDVRLPFANSTCDVVFSNNVIECLSRPAEFAMEVVRVLKPGGRAVIAHWDWDTQVFNGNDKARVRRLVHAFADWQQAWMKHSDGWMGRRLKGVFGGAPGFDVTLQSRVMLNVEYSEPWFGFTRAQEFRSLAKRNLASAGDVEAFLRDQAELSALGQYVYGITGFALIGTKT